jgi:hypothetical protein
LPSPFVLCLPQRDLRRPSAALRSGSRTWWKTIRQITSAPCTPATGVGLKPIPSRTIPCFILPSPLLPRPNPQPRSDGDEFRVLTPHPSRLVLVARFSSVPAPVTRYSLLLANGNSKALGSRVSPPWFHEVPSRSVAHAQPEGRKFIKRPQDQQKICPRSKGGLASGRPSIRLRPRTSPASFQSIAKRRNWPLLIRWTG